MLIKQAKELVPSPGDDMKPQPWSLQKQLKTAFVPVSTTEEAFCVGGFRLYQISSEESCYQLVFCSSQAPKKNTLKQLESPGQMEEIK